MILALLLAAAPHAGNDEVAWIEASLEPPGELLNAHFADVDLDGRDEIVLAVRTAEGSRELRIHRIFAQGVEPAPHRIVPVLDDAVAYGFADVRPEAGRELLFLAKGGAWSLSLAREGYRGNLARLVELDLLFDVANPARLPVWEYVFPRAGGDWILLPGETGYVVFGPSEAGYRRLASFPGLLAFSVDRNRHGRRSVTIGSGDLNAGKSASVLPERFLSDARTSSGEFLSLNRSYLAPALLDLDGDGFLDLLVHDFLRDKLSIFSGAGELGEAPDRVEYEPDYFPRGSVELEFVDLDGDGDPDLIVREKRDYDGLENAEVELLLLLNEGGRLLPEKPHQVLRFEAAELNVNLADVDGDGRPDLTVREFRMPSLLATASGLEFTLSYLVYRGQAGERPFERKPLLKQSETYDETTLEAVIKNRVWRMDFDGDGLADLVEVDLKGRITVRRTVRSRSFFGSGSWSLEATPWRRFETAGNIDELEVRDLNGDGLGDIVSRGERALTVLLSARKGGGK